MAADGALAAAEAVLSRVHPRSGHVLRDAASPAIAGGAVAVEGRLIAACGTAEEVRAAYPEAETISLGHACLMPGLVNAHQHGRV